ncbi:hypothetical protein AVEN_118149-1 [Araneus ventricosus]|uniref:Uncharacterized protein n=1 Tax=Araneus ventricosus TaxID=182803 RepID=A0A4Y2P6H1_ARAVE|nr:hypothetical protein AVEN_118149-1 [Araneus ventricosus]
MLQTCCKLKLLYGMDFQPIHVGGSFTEAPFKRSLRPTPPKYISVHLGVIMANVGKRKAFPIGAERHRANTFSQNEIEHFECCDDDVVISGEVSEEDIVAL